MLRYAETQRLRNLPKSESELTHVITYYNVERQVTSNPIRVKCLGKCPCNCNKQRYITLDNKLYIDGITVLMEIEKDESLKAKLVRLF